MSTARRKLLGWLIGFLVLALGILLSRSDTADASFNIEAASFDVPTPLTLSLYRGGQFELKNFTTNGFTGKLAFRVAANVHASEKRSLAPNATSIGLAMGVVQPFLKGSRAGGVKEITLDVAPPALLEIAMMEVPGSQASAVQRHESVIMPGIAVTPQGQGDAKLTVDSSSIAIERSAYYLISEIGPKDLSEFSGVFSGNPQSTDRTARLDLESSSPNTHAELYFFNEGREMRLVEKVELSNQVALSFHDVTYASILIQGDSAADPNLSRPTSVDMTIKKGTIDVLDLLPAEDDQKVKLRVKGTADAFSVREGGKELRPTALADVLRDPWASRHIRLIIGCLVAAAGLKLINHLLDLALKWGVGD